LTANIPNDSYCCTGGIKERPFAAIPPRDERGMHRLRPTLCHLNSLVRRRDLLATMPRKQSPSRSPIRETHLGGRFTTGQRQMCASSDQGPAGGERTRSSPAYPQTAVGIERGCRVVAARGLYFASTLVHF
jgi:hypothetical protein